MKKIVSAIATTGFLFCVAESTSACAVCFGAEDSLQTQGVNMAIATMLGVTWTVLGLMGGAGAFLWRRSLHLDDDSIAPVDAGDTEGEDGNE